MKRNALLFLIATTSTVGLTTPLFAHDSEVVSHNELTLKQAMQGLLKNTQDITQGIFLEDYKLIATSANKIYDHPKPALHIRQKIMQNLGEEMAEFKAFDSVVHHKGLAIVAAAKQKNMPLVVDNYHSVIDACLACHGKFKQKISKVLNRDD